MPVAKCECTPYARELTHYLSYSYFTISIVIPQSLMYGLKHEKRALYKKIFYACRKWNGIN